MAIGDLPMLAAGGITDGRGSRLHSRSARTARLRPRASWRADESDAASGLKAAILSAHASDTLHTSCTDVGWPDAAHRVIRTPLVDAGSGPASEVRP